MRSSVLLAALTVAFAASSLAASPPFDMPKRKSGLWEMTVHPAGAPAPGATAKQCVDQKSDDVMRNQAREAKAQLDKDCSKQDWKQVSGGWEFESVCTFAGTKHTTKGTLTGSMDSGYKMVMDAQYDPPMNGIATNHMEMEAKWIGACPPDMRPGDMIMPSGARVNVEELKNMRRPPQPPAQK
jgi:hypothetical protein